ncbi:hypothetical protein NL676_016764 [Syzygium grande]|nr:hypothetical protein NL676_016764 [Syzygium grande]
MGHLLGFEPELISSRQFSSEQSLGFDRSEKGSCHPLQIVASIARCPVLEPIDLRDQVELHADDASDWEPSCPLKNRSSVRRSCLTTSPT